MIVEDATVASVGAGYAIVRTQGASQCARCASGQGCGGMLMGRLLGDRLHTVRVLLNDHREVLPGDAVRIGLAERALLASATIAYLVPLAGLFAGMLASYLTSGSEPVAIAGAAIGFATGVAGARWLAHRAGRDPAYHPVIIDRPLASSVGSVSGDLTDA